MTPMQTHVVAGGKPAKARRAPPRAHPIRAASVVTPPPAPGARGDADAAGSMHYTAVIRLAGLAHLTPQRAEESGAPGAAAGAANAPPPYASSDTAGPHATSRSRTHRAFLLSRRASPLPISHSPAACLS